MNATTEVINDENVAAFEAVPHQPALKSGKGAKFQKTVTIKRPISEVYNFWRNLQNLPRFMNHLESVTVKDRYLSHWVVKTNEGKFEWDAEIFENRVDEIISWQSLPGGDVDTAGSVRFKAGPNNRTTIVKIVLKYSPPGGKLAIQVSKFFGQDAAPIIEEDLNRFKTVLESGELPNTDIEEPVDEAIVREIQE